MMKAKTIDHGLSKAELATMRSIFHPYSKSIESVGIFGSRANGNYKEYSDIDLVLYENLDRKIIYRLNTLFDESKLGIKVDIKAYRLIEYSPLKRHIDAVSKTLFTQSELIRANEG